MVERLTVAFDNKIWNRVSGILFPVVLILFSMMHIGEGITATDTGYNYGNFVFLDGLDNMWRFSTYLANAVGAFLVNLPFGHTMLGLNFYTGLFKTVAALAAYFACIKLCKMRKESVFAAEMFALGLCWCPTALLYNYMTYFFFMLGAFLIFASFKTEKSSYLVLAGVCLGLNFMVRLPNVAEVALIVCVWYGGIIYKKNGKKILQDTLWCMAGYFATIGVFVGYIAVRYGLDAYIEGIRALFAMTENATSYSAVSMVLDSVKMYLHYGIWFAVLCIIIVFGILGFMVKKEKFPVLKKAVVILLVGLYAVLAYWNEQYTFDYRNYPSMFFWGVLFLMISLALCAYTLFLSNCKKELKLLASLAAVIIVITPIGSNNHLYSPMNNLFFVAPVVLAIIRDLLSAEKSVMIKDKVEVYTYPIKTVLVCVITIIMLQSVLFGANFVFRDGTDGGKRIYEVENNAVLAGMKTTKENAENLQGINDYLSENGLIGDRALLFGNVPAFAFYFSLEPAISTTWPDLHSFSVNKFCEEMDRLEERELPLVIMDIETKEQLCCEEERENLQDDMKQKLERLQKFLMDNEYTECYANDGFTIYRFE